MTWTRKGECNDCGFCCQKIAREPIVRHEEQVKRDAPFYLARGFKPQVLDGETVYVLWAWLDAPCPEHTPSGCAIHLTKPKTCQEFPTLPREIVGTPCSYWFEDEHGRAVGGTGSPHPSSESALIALEGK